MTAEPSPAVAGRRQEEPVAAYGVRWSWELVLLYFQQRNVQPQNPAIPVIHVGRFRVYDPLFNPFIQLFTDANLRVRLELLSGSTGDSYQLALELDKAWNQSTKSGTPIDIESSLWRYEDARRLRVVVIHGLARMAAIMASTYKAFLGVGLGPLSVSVDEENGNMVHVTVRLYGPNTECVINRERELQGRCTMNLPPMHEITFSTDDKPKLLNQFCLIQDVMMALEVVTGVIASLIFLVALLTAAHRCKRKPSIIIPWKKPRTDKHCMAIIVDTDMLKDVMRYSRQELEVACENFSNIIGSSSDSTVYKGTISGGPEIAVISLSNQEEHWTSYIELYFQKEVADLARLNHEHIGKPQTFIFIVCLANQRSRSMARVPTPSYRHLPAGTIVPWLCP
ncbi:hypothetical protein L1887_39947 [Cichorium endivia]|nr:hypothetical protein L1887_39947 [Cichorium endivia]